MTKELIIAILLIVALVGVVAFTLYLYLKNKTLNDIRADVYKLFLKAEHMYKAGAGKTKMDFVVRKARELLPSWAQVFITEDVLRKAVQIWFDAVKDLLDDGKFNGTGKEGVQ